MISTGQVLPSLFISHGAPDILLSGHEALAALKDLAVRLPRPRAIVVVSAHWIADPIGVTVGEPLPTIHDFGGFPDALYAMQYPASGDRRLADELMRRLDENGLDRQLYEGRGLDHGAWIPLTTMFPEADIPVVQVSLPTGSMEDLTRLGVALGPLRRQGALIIGSGGSTHNLRALNRLGKADAWAIEFEQWLLESIECGPFDRLITPELFPPTFHRAHPTLEHYAPLVVAWAAGDRDRPGQRLHHSFSYGNLGMSLFSFGANANV